jgi:hypothetical protein
MGNRSSSNIDTTAIEQPIKREKKEVDTVAARGAERAATDLYNNFDKFYDKVFASLIRSNLIDRDIAEEVIQYVNLYQTIDDEHEGYLTEAHKISDYNIREYNERNQVAFERVEKKIITQINELNKNPELQPFIINVDTSSISIELLSLSEENRLLLQKVLRLQLLYFLLLFKNRKRINESRMRPVSPIMEFYKFKKDIWKISRNGDENWEVEITKVPITNLFADSEPSVYFLLTSEDSFPHPAQRLGGSNCKMKTRHMNKKKQRKQENKNKKKIRTRRK